MAQQSDGRQSACTEANMQLSVLQTEISAGQNDIKEKQRKRIVGIRFAVCQGTWAIGAIRAINLLRNRAIRAINLLRKLVAGVALVAVDVIAVVWYNDREIAALRRAGCCRNKKQRIMDIRFIRKAGLWAGWMRSKRSL